MTDFNPSSEQKLEGGGLNATQEDAIMSLAPTRTSLAARNPDNERPESPLINAPSVLRTAPLADDACMALARQSYDNSEMYFNAAHRTRIIDAMARFNNEHPKGSKYNQPAFERRSKLFRPKTRSSVRRREAAAAISLFGSSDIVNIRAESGETGSTLDARIQEALLNYRLQEDDRWYKLVVGSVQDADRQGFCIAKTYWEYEEANIYYNEMHADMGVIPRVDTVAVKDRPGWSLLPVERLRFSPASDWVDPINSSPYLIEVMPMFVCDVRKYENNKRAKLKYRHLTDSQLMSGGHTGEWDAIRMQRERNRMNRYERNDDPSDYAVVWVHRNIIKIEGEDYVFDTVGTSMMLSNVIPLSEFDPRNYRPYVIGAMMVEAHNPFQVGGVTLMGGIQDEINDVTNLRVDANKMAISGRMFIKRNTGVDMHALARFSPGAVVEMDNPTTDVKWDRSPEPPTGSYEETQLLSTELDDLIGNFGQASVADNRNLNETVGGMQIMGESANQLQEYDLHTLASTFLTKILTQILDLEKHWETDQKLVQIIGLKLATSAKQFWKALKTESKVLVNMGFGATNPAKRLQRLQTAMQTVAGWFPMALYQSDQAEILKEVFAAAGFPEVSRFFPFIDNGGQPDKDPKVAALQQQLQSMVMKLYPGQMHNEGLIQREQIRQQGLERVTQMKIEGQLQLQNAESEAAWKIKTAELNIAYIDLQMVHEKNDVARAQLMLNREKLSNDITIQRMEIELARLTAVASANPPVVDVDAEGQQESAALNTPGSSLTAAAPFQRDVASAGSYVQRGGLGGPSPQATPTDDLSTPMPNQPMLTPPPLGAPPSQTTNI